MSISYRKFSVIALTLITFLAMFAALQPAFSTEYIAVDDYCWIEGEHMDIGFSKYGEMIGYNEDTETGLGIQYPGYESAGNTYDQTDDTAIDPFCNEYIGVDWWMNGWFIDIKYRTPAGVYREIWAMAMFSDGTGHGGDWITMPSVPSNSSARPLWQEYQPYAHPDSFAYIGIVDPLPTSGGRKTNGRCLTEDIEIMYNGPGGFIAQCKTTVSDVGGGTDLVALYFTFIFNKAEKNVIILKDVKRLYTKQPMNIQFGNRGQWDLGIAGDTDSYVHWYTGEPVQYWDTDGDGAINGTEVETTFEVYKDYFLANKHPEKWWDEVPDEERPTTIYDEWADEMVDFPETWLETQEGSYGLEEHMDSTIKENSYAVAQVISGAGDYVGALAVWPHPEFWSAANTYFPPARTRPPGGTNPSQIPLMLSPISRALEWHKWTVEEDPTSGDYPHGYLDDRDDMWVTADDIRYPSGSTLEPIIPFIIYEHDFRLSSTLPEYRIVSAYLLSNYHDADDADADDPGNEESWSSGLNIIDSEIQYQLDRIFNPTPPPVASFTYSPESPVVDQTVTFNASASYDSHGFIVNYNWDFGDETTDTGEIVEHIYDEVGTYTVALTVVDNDGLTDTATHPITIRKLSSSISITASPTTITIGESTIISGAITPTRVGATVTIGYRMIGESWGTLATVTTNETSQYSYIWTPSDTGAYEVNASWLGDENTLAAESSIVAIEVIPPRILAIKLTGEHDYLLRENVKIRLAAHVKDSATTEPISDADVTIQIFDADGVLWVSDLMVEKLVSTGIYEWETEETIKRLRLEKGVYLAHVVVSSEGSLTTSDILTFHIDPPGEEPLQLHWILLFIVTAALATTVSAWYADHRRTDKKAF